MTRDEGVSERADPWAMSPEELLQAILAARAEMTSERERYDRLLAQRDREHVEFTARVERLAGAERERDELRLLHKDAADAVEELSEKLRVATEEWAAWQERAVAAEAKAESR